MNSGILYACALRVPFTYWVNDLPYFETWLNPFFPTPKHPRSSGWLNAVCLHDWTSALCPGFNSTIGEWQQRGCSHHCCSKLGSKYFIIATCLPTTMLMNPSRNIDSYWHHLCTKNNHRVQKSLTWFEQSICGTVGPRESVFKLYLSGM